ncbi:hypothetical protein [Caballeronia glebae]|uniref:hypothetical protein n=1 Tax=Caballeronia glebae TaxID=1777143 RepID=UPI0038B6B314
MQKKRIILAAAMMSMILIAFMSMNSIRDASDMFQITRAAPEQMLLSIDSHAGKQSMRARTLFR